MPVVDVINLEGQVVGQIELAEAVFGAKVNEALLWESVRHYMALRRAGTHKTKRRWFRSTREVLTAIVNLKLHLG